MKTNTSGENRASADDSTIETALWVLFATAWFVMAVLFVRHGVFSATLLLLIALICLPGMRAAFGRKTGIRVPGVATTAAILTLAFGSFISAGRNFEMQQSEQRPAPGAAEPVGPTHFTAAATSISSLAPTVTLVATVP